MKFAFIDVNDLKVKKLLSLHV